MITATNDHDVSSSYPTKSGQLHELPCVIGYEGKANTSEFFVVTPSSDELRYGNDVVEASFRGRQLLGSVRKLPDYVRDPNLSIHGGFDSVVSWQCDRYLLDGDQGLHRGILAIKLHENLLN